MAVNIFRDELQHAQLFGKPVLTTNWLIPRETVPDRWFCYDMRGTESDPAAHAVLVDYTSYDHSGTVLSPKPLKRPATKARRIGKGDYFLHGETMDLEAFCEEYGLDFPDNPIKFEMRPALPDEAGLFYVLPPEQDEELGAIGHVRMDFGRDGDGWCVDCILTHCAPSGILPQIDLDYRPDPLTDFLETVRQRCRFSAWFLGHYHTNQIIDERFVIQWEQISKVE